MAEKCPNCGASLHSHREHVQFWVCGSSYCERLKLFTEGLDCLRRQLAQAKAIVDKLPKTADGVSVVPGMEVWRWDAYLKCVKQCVVDRVYQNGGVGLSFHDNDEGGFVSTQLYSTREAAEAAKGNPND